MRPKEELAVVLGEDRVVLQDLERLTDPPLVLEGTAAEIWRLLDGRSVDDIVAALVVVHGEPAAVIAPGVLAFLEDLAARDLVR